LTVTVVLPAVTLPEALALPAELVVLEAELVTFPEGVAVVVVVVEVFVVVFC